MFIVISAIVLASTTSALHILPCEPGYPGPLGCDQFVANGGRLDGSHGTPTGQGDIFGQGGSFGTGGNFGQSAGSLATDPSFWANPGLEQANMVDPTQFIDPNTQLFDPTSQFIDPTQMVDPSVAGGFGPGQFDQAIGAVPPGLDFVGGNAAASAVYPKGLKGKISKLSYPKGFSKKSLKGYPKGVSKKGMLSGYPKGFAKKDILGSYPRGKLGFWSMYGKYPSMFGKSYYSSKKNYGFLGGYPKSFKVKGYSKRKYLPRYGGYPKSGLMMKMGYGKFRKAYSKGYPKFSMRSKKFVGGY